MASWNSTNLIDIRRSMVLGRPIEGCKQCYLEEANGNRGSLRHRSFTEWLDGRADIADLICNSINNNFFVSDSPKYLELKPGNLCNLKCRMCNQYDSSKVARELKELSKKYTGLVRVGQSRLFDSENFDVNFDLSQMPNWGDKKEVWATVEKMLPHLEVISFAGGEPTLIEGVSYVLQRCVETNNARHIKVFFSSNFMQMPRLYIDLAPHFKCFEFIASIDGYGPIQEYIRHPSKWKTVSANFKKFKEIMSPETGCKILANITVQINNILHLTPLLYWLDELHQEPPHFFHHPYHLNILYGPSYLSLDLLPPPGRKIAITRIEKYIKESKIINDFPDMKQKHQLIIDRLQAPLPSNYLKKLKSFWRFTKLLDEHRSESLKNSDSELYDLVFNELTRQGVRSNEVAIPVANPPSIL